MPPSTEGRPADLLKVTVTNFKGIVQETYEFPQTGCVRLEGPNGSGKTSLMMAIVWGLTGKVPRVRSLARRGVKAYSVVIEAWGVKITRVNTPATIEVVAAGETLTGELAEEAISKLIGIPTKKAAWGLFQTSASSLVGLAPAEQYQVISEISGVDLTDIQSRIDATQQAIVKAETEANEFRVDLAKYTSIIARCKQELQGLPLGPYRPGEEAKLRSTLTAATKTRAELQEKLDLKGETDDVATLQAELEAAKQIKLPKKPEVDLESLRETTAGYQAVLAAIETRDELESHVKASAQEKEETIVRIETRLRGMNPAIREVRDQLRADHRDYERRMEVYQSTLQTKKAAQGLMKKLFGDLKKTFHDIPEIQEAKTPKTMIEALTSTRKKFLRVMECPSCSERLIEGQAGHLEVAEVTTTKANPRRRAQIDEGLNNIHPQLVSDFNLKADHPGEPPEDLAKVEAQLTEYDRLRAELRTANIAVDPVMKKLETLAANKKAAVAELGDDWVEEMDLLDLEGCRNHLEDLKIDLDTATKSHARYSLRLSAYNRAQKKIPILTSKLSTSGESSSEILKKISECADLIAQTTTTLAAVEGRKRRAEIEKTLTSAETNSVTIEERLAEREELVKGLGDIKKLIKTAALMTFRQTVDAINSHASRYLDLFFVEPIRVAISLPEDQGGKTSLDIFYKNQESTYDDFSQGEAQKVRLAFFLAVSEVLGSKLIVIDEALSNIDDQSKPIVLEAISTAKAGLKLVATHNEDQGVFDFQVSLG